MDQLQAAYFKEYLERGVRRIYEAQRGIAAAKIYAKTYGRARRTGRLMEALEHPNFLIGAGNTLVSSKLDWPIYIRFLDMKRHGNYKIYNRQVWGILYKETLRDLRYEFSDWLKKNLSRDISNGFQQQ